MPNGKKSLGKLFLGHRVQEVRLVLVTVSSFLQKKAPGARDFFDLRMVPGGEDIRVQSQSPLHQHIEFDVLIAPDARIRRAPPSVLFEKIRDNKFLKGLLQIPTRFVLCSC